MPSAEIITIGTELLLGETVDTNTRFIARALRGLGVDLFRALTIGDNPVRIATAISEAMARAEIVITTGGLGPTVDDPTRQAVAEAAGVELEYRPELWEQVEARVRRYGRTPGENQKRQAYVPCGALAVENPVGTAPAFIVETERNAVIALPGVPREMETLLTLSVLPYLQKRFDLHQMIKVRTLHAAGIGESSVDERIGDLELLSNPTVGLTAHAGIIDIRIAAKADGEAAADAMIAVIEEKVRERMGALLYGADDDTLEAAALQAAAARGWTLAGCEAGMDGALLDLLARAGSATFRGGERLDTLPVDLAEAVETTCKRYGASAGLGASVTLGEEHSVIRMLLRTPEKSEERQRTYGGHPRYAPRWAANLTLEWLRESAGKGAR